MEHVCSFPHGEDWSSTIVRELLADGLSHGLGI